MDERCKTKYPVLLVHGAGFRDLKLPLYWGRIPGVLQDHGAEVFFGGQDAWGSTRENAKMLVQRIEELCRQTGSEKLNLIAHSKGCLEARMAASSLGAGDRIASITTIATPHHGSRTISRLFRLPKPLFSAAAFAVNFWMRLVGDRSPDYLASCQDLSEETAERFNAENPDVPGIRYCSYACCMRGPLSDLSLWLSYLVVRHFEGPNDGLVSVSSASWGETILLQGAGRRGVSHSDAIDLRRHALSKREGSGVREIPEVYVQILEDLKSSGL